ncbi:uncharacterized protein LY89DRAFT_647446 [Mollisia scopiformis]|uniref:R3H domain-containing protein n=1 Tax=Mollisia scopiformis TaxID=149040 RepID=A0A194X736_MOLSC|nr:uncharacterized protein LY89DRAFT_647446 [Mollisia scopiformis]KUJ15622.1 hypothetical protein LY89DRAFT_647446 [Mollisia scopiformis]
MTTAQMSADKSRLSFAKVAASAGKDNVALSSFAKVAASAQAKDLKKENIAIPGQAETSTQPNGLSDIQHTSTDDGKSNENLVEAVKALSINAAPSLVVNGSGIVRNKSEGPDDESGSDLGTRPPSFTSGTTFALDEKESLRPDDSASVKAAEDDDTFSGRGSIVAGSRIGSEAAARAYRAQFYDAPDRRNMQNIHERQSQGVSTPQSGSSGQQTTDDGKSKPLIGTPGVPDAFNLFYRQTPDEKLLEALESPKDRIFLLRLEQDVIEFVKSSKEPFIDLPPCNSFCRMLTHKLADYYHMTHQVDAIAGAVRIFRTPFCRLPPSLTSISNPPTSGNTPPPTMPAMKIMRRGGDGDTGPSPSKATSETGSDGKDKSLSAKEKLSREEREAAYNKARERIFGKDDKAGDVTPDTEDGNEMSRSSSVSTKDRTSQNKRAKPAKQRRDDSENFDVRSQYAPYFPQPQAPTWVPTQQYAPMGPPQFSGGTAQPSYQNPMQPHFGPQQFNPGVMTGVNMQYNPPQQYPPQGQQRFQQPHSAPISGFASPVQSPPPAPQQWPQPLYQSPYQQSQTAMVRGPPNSIPYAFGQLPSTANPADPKSQHPIPGSFNRHAFNPKTQSFVPGSSGLPVPQPMSHHGSPHHGSPHHGSPHLPYNAFATPQQQFGNGMGYNMARQGSNNSLPSYHASPHMAQRPMMHQGMPQNLPQGMSHSQGMPQGVSQVMPMAMSHIGNHLPNYGNPSTLPPKPPTGV